MIKDKETARRITRLAVCECALRRTSLMDESS